MVLFLLKFMMRRNLSIDCIGPGKLKSKPILTRIWDSSSIKDCLLTYFFSSLVRRFIILVKLGEIGYSSLADIRTLMVARLTICDYGKFWGPTMWMYLSRMPAAMNSVSCLYSFLTCRSKIF